MKPSNGHIDRSNTRSEQVKHMEPLGTAGLKRDRRGHDVHGSVGSLKRNGQCIRQQTSYSVLCWSAVFEDESTGPVECSADSLEVAPGLWMLTPDSPSISAVGGGSTTGQGQ